MPAFMTIKKCEACGGQHDLCLPDYDIMDAAQEYEYTCPETGDAIRIKTDQWAKVVPACPSGSVIIKPVAG